MHTIETERAAAMGRLKIGGRIIPCAQTPDSLVMDDKYMAP